MIFYVRSALVALQFLSQIPVSFKHAPTPAEVGTSLCFYPLVGLLLGTLLWLLATLLSGAPVFVAAVILLIGWVWFSGALHLDGLADSADAWFGGRGDRTRTLEIMKDPAAGPIAVVVLVMGLLLKVALIMALLQHAILWPLLLAPVVGRLMPPLLLLTTPYVSRQGLGQMLVDTMPRQAVGWALACSAMLILWVEPLSFWVMVVLLVLYRVMRSLMLRRLGGVTGDTLGAAVELIEASWLLLIVLFITVWL